MSISNFIQRLLVRVQNQTIKSGEIKIVLKHVQVRIETTNFNQRPICEVGVQIYLQMNTS